MTCQYLEGPKCPKLAKKHGLCDEHYQAMERMVNAGVFTWEAWEAMLRNLIVMQRTFRLSRNARVHLRGKRNNQKQ